MVNIKILIHRTISWLLVPFTLVTLLTGYAMTRGWHSNNIRMSKIHRVFEWFFIVLILTHIIYTQIYVRAKWSKMVTNVQENRGRWFYTLKIASRITSWLIVLFVLLVILSGFNGYVWFASTIGKVIPFDWHRRFDTVLSVFILIHTAIGLNFVLIRRKAKDKSPERDIKFNRRSIVTNATTIAIITIIALSSIQLSPQLPPQDPDNPGVLGSVTIGSSNFTFNSSYIVRTRPEIFTDGAFSLFDILVYLENDNQIEMTYHYDELMDTHVIESLQNEPNWWYYAYYDGGWPETNAFRIDHYPWKLGTTFVMQKESEGFIESVYDSFREEVLRKENNLGKVIIPEVRIRASDRTTLTFTDVEVTAHNLRPDLFVNGTITAIDVIMSLGDQGEITYGLIWYEAIGTAEIVRNYFITSINLDIAYGTCGFVYENGDEDFGGYNHIHIPPDARVLVSPEYAYWFWICL